MTYDYPRSRRTGIGLFRSMVSGIDAMVLSHA